MPGDIGSYVCRVIQESEYSTGPHPGLAWRGIRGQQMRCHIVDKYTQLGRHVAVRWPENVESAGVRREILQHCTQATLLELAPNRKVRQAGDPEPLLCQANERLNRIGDGSS